MARIVGVEIPDNKNIEIALTYIYGIGRSTAQKILKAAGVDFSKKTKDLTEAELTKIQDIISTSYKVEGELRKEIAMNIQRLKDIRCYRGIRHIKGLPVRGQRTRTNARTRKGPRPRIGTKKKSS